MICAIGWVHSIEDPSACCPQETQKCTFKGCWEVQTLNGVDTYIHHQLYSDDPTDGEWMQFDDACITHQCITTDVCVTPTCDGADEYPGSGVTSVTENCASTPDCYAENGMELRVLNQADVDSLATCCLLWECIQRDDVCLEPVANDTPIEESVSTLIPMPTRYSHDNGLLLNSLSQIR